MAAGQEKSQQAGEGEKEPGELFSERSGVHRRIRAGIVYYKVKM
jgi:hypothetical protein